MNTYMHDSPITIHAIGEDALHILSSAQQGSVMASVTNALYLFGEQGELCWLIPTTGPMHQRAMQISAPLPRLNVGSRYKVVDHTITTSTGEILDFRRSRNWTSPTITLIDSVSLSTLSGSLLAVVNQLLAQHIPTGLGDLIIPIIQMTTLQNGALEVSIKSIAEKAWPAIEGIILATLANDSDLIIDQAKFLVGFGEGLTPSGDDFLGGFFFSRQLLYHYYPKVLRVPIRTYSDFILQSKPLTNLISYAILKDHADGRSIEPLHQLTNGLLLGEPVDRLILYTEKLIALGHSTGWDLLTGFLAGMFVTFAQ